MTEHPIKQNGQFGETPLLSGTCYTGLASMRTRYCEELRASLAGVSARQIGDDGRRRLMVESVSQTKRGARPWLDAMSRMVQNNWRRSRAPSDGDRQASFAAVISGCDHAATS